MRKLYHVAKIKSQVLIIDIIEDGHKVGIYPISHNAWIDVGQWPEYNKAIEKM